MQIFLTVAVGVLWRVVKSSADAPPTYDAAKLSYEETINPTVGYTATYRPGAFWSLNTDSFEYLGIDGTTNSRTQPPTGIPFNNTNTNVLATAGIKAHVHYTSAPDPNDKALLTNGNEGSCVMIKGFTANEDLCLKDPSLCSLGDATRERGISMSMWINLPHTFNTDWRSILDTGGTSTGKTGIAIRIRGSQDGRRFSHEIEFIVSTGQKYWRAVLNGMTAAYNWNNIGFRWSDELRNGIPYGLQVFVNGSSTAWKRSPYNSGATGKPVLTTNDIKVSIGCNNTGGHAQQGIYANLAFWYWRLKDTDADMKPVFGDTAATKEETQYLLGGLTFTPGMTNLDIGDAQGPAACGTPGVCMNAGAAADDENPWQYDYEMNNRGKDDYDDFYVDDTSPAYEGDCDPQNPNTWGNGYFNNDPHPVDCADTMKELKLALDHDSNYQGMNLVRAMVRVVTRNEQAVSFEDIEYLYKEALMKAVNLLQAETSLPELRDADTYANIAYIVSRLSNYDLYGQKWASVAVKYGPTFWMNALDYWLMEIAKRIPQKTSAQREANHTVVNVIRVKGSQINAGLVFPDYAAMVTNSKNEKENLYQFTTQRKGTWGWCRDQVTLPVGFFNGYNDSSDIRIVAKLYNDMHKNLPIRIDSRVTGTSEVTWKINSRIMSLSLTSDEVRVNDTLLTQYPVLFSLEHKDRQSEHPVKKGAILCVHWHYNDNDSQAIGTWDTSGCILKKTNDTHSTCECSHMTDYALLMEKRKAPGEVGDAGYYFCYALYGVSMALLFVFLIIVVGSIRLHYELHIITMNIAVAMFFAILFYLCTLAVYEDRMGCVLISILMHYCYTACYLWCVLLSHYLFRAVTSAKMGGVLSYYCLIGWGLPALICIILAAVDVTRYGIGERCLGAQEGYFLWVYIGTFIFFCVLVCPLFVIAIINLNKNAVKDPEDREDVKWTLFGIMGFWPFIMLVWLMAMLVYLIPQDTMIVDFLFEFFNSLQGIMIFLLLGILVPAFRGCICCCLGGRPKTPNDNELYGITENEEELIASTPTPVSAAKIDEPDDPPPEEKEPKKEKKDKKKKKKEDEEPLDKSKDKDAKSEKPKKPKNKKKSTGYGGSDMFGK